MARKSTLRKSASAKIGRMKTNAKRTIKKAAANVHTNADRARELGAALVRAGELIQEGASLLDAIAGHATGEVRGNRRALRLES